MSAKFSGEQILNDLAAHQGQKRVEIANLLQQTQDDIAPTHAFVAFQHSSECIISNIKICADMAAVREYQAAHMANRYIYGTPAIVGGFGDGTAAYFPIFPSADTSK